MFEGRGTMVEFKNPETLPASVKLAAVLFVVYGVAVVLNATVMQAAGGWGASRDFPRAILRLIGTGLIAWGLLRRARWAWWLGLVLAVFWLAAGALAVLVLERGDVYWLPPSGFQIFLVVSLVCLGAAVALLISPSARAVFRRPAV
jgi:peptidoglycan/LPS O-acetylase OafA/YrhL